MGLALPEGKDAEVPDTLPVRPGALSALLVELARTPAEGSAWDPVLRPGSVVGRFELVREIGRGGFGVVWEARDRELPRAVAFKAVRGGDHPDVRQERLLREAEAAARLSHPNIVTLYDVGRSPQGPYLILELLRGGTLAQRLRQGRLPVREALRVALEMAKGLAHAHAQGVVHRDVKPGNVFLCDDGQVKLLDLGMAHAFGHRTFAGGTPAYMAPEQWRGAPEDERTDVFAEGVVLFETLAGTVPFPDEGAARGPGVAPALDLPAAPGLSELLARMLAKDPVSRPRDAAEVLDELTAVSESLPREGEQEPVARVLRPGGWRALPTWVPLAGAAVLSVLLLALPLALPGPGAPLLRAAGGLGLLGVAGALAWLGLRARSRARRSDQRRERAPPAPPLEPPPAAVEVQPPPPATPSIAVLPFQDMSPGRDQEHLSDGVAEEILNALAHVEGLRVAGRTSSFSFKGKQEDLRSIGRRLGVGAVVEGGVRREGSRVRITAQVIHVADGLTLWSEVYDRDAANVFAIQDEIAQAVVSALKVKLLPGHGPASTADRATTPEAYGHFLRGRQLHNRGTADGYRAAAEAHEQALRLDPLYAPAWSGLAIALAMLWSASGDETLAGVPDLRRRALEAAEKAVRLGPGLSDAHAVRATLRAMAWDWQGAEADIARALALDPGDVRALRTRGWLLAAHGRIRESIEVEKRAGGLDPLNPAGWVNLASRHLALGEVGPAREALDLSREISPASQGMGRTQALLASLLSGEGEGALAIAQELPDERSRLWGAALAYHCMGHARASQHALDALASRFGERVAYPIAQVHAFRGAGDQAFAWLDKAFARHEVALESLQFDPLFLALHGEPRYAALLRRMDLPAA